MYLIVFLIILSNSSFARNKPTPTAKPDPKTGIVSNVCEGEGSDTALMHIHFLTPKFELDRACAQAKRLAKHSAEKHKLCSGIKTICNKHHTGLFWSDISYYPENCEHGKPSFSESSSGRYTETIEISVTAVLRVGCGQRN